MVEDSKSFGFRAARPHAARPRRWLLGESKIFSKHWWFWLHGTCQLTGMALFIAGFVVAFVKFGETEGELVEAHSNIGIAVMAAAGTQVGYVNSGRTRRLGAWPTRPCAFSQLPDVLRSSGGASAPLAGRQVLHLSGPLGSLAPSDPVGVDGPTSPHNALGHLLQPITHPFSSLFCMSQY
jgi:hypothetical protein